MKLYTEEAVKMAIESARENSFGSDFQRWLTKSEKSIMEELTPIELPSDEEMVKAKYEHEMCVFADEYASYILDQSKLGIKGAMVSMCAWTFFKNRRNEQQ